MSKTRVIISSLLAVAMALVMVGCGHETVVVPGIISTLPASGAVNVAINTTISATFSLPMNAATISGSTFTVTGPGATTVAGTVTYSSSGQVATFTPAANLAYSTVYTATLTTGITDLGGTSFLNNYVWTFTTITPPPVVMSTVPAPGATNVPITQVLSATFSETMNCATLTSPATNFTLAGPGSTTVAGTVACTGSVATFTPTLPLSYSTLYTATIKTGAQDIAGQGLVSNYVWTFTTITTPPMVIATLPVSGATGVLVTQAITATFNEAMNCATLVTPATNFILTGPGAANVAGAVSCAGSIATFTPNANLAANTLYTATIKTGAQDIAGQGLAVNYVWSFITGAAPLTPMVIATVPINGAIAVPVNTSVLATFNEAMAAASINTTTFTLTGPGATPVTGTVTYVAAGSTATFTPTTPLAVSTLYTATITTGATSLSGTALAANYVWTFTTSATTNATRPTVIATIPLNAATNVPLNQILSATFSKAMNPATINSNNFNLQVTGGATVPGVVAYAAVANTLTFTPSANLAPSTQYTATITTGVTDLSGNALLANYVWTFTTGTTTLTAAPEIVSTSPANAATAVPTNQPVSATFSEAMNPLTITTTSFQLAPPSGPNVSGTVTYNPVTYIATFTPLAPLAINTIYTASITGATDTYGNPLGNTGAPNPWFFTTGTTMLNTAPNLGSAQLFGIIGGLGGVTNSGAFTVINGDIATTGVSTKIVDLHDTAGCSYGETPVFTGGLVNGTIDTAPPPPTLQCIPNEGTAATSAIAAQASADALIAYNSITPASLPGGLAVETCPGCGGVLFGAGELGARTLAPGVYVSTPGSYSITAGPLTLDAQGNPNAVWVFQMGTSLTVGSPSSNESVVLMNGAQAKNVFWQVGSAATINGILGGGTMVGTVIALSGVTVSTVGVAAITTINGRILSLGPAVTIVNTVITVPAP